MNYDDEDSIKPFILCSYSYSLIFLEDTLLTPRRHFCHQLLEEMLDNGFPLATEPNILRELINPPSIVRQVVNTMTGGSQ